MDPNGSRRRQLEAAVLARLEVVSASTGGRSAVTGQDVLAAFVGLRPGWQCPSDVAKELLQRSGEAPRPARRAAQPAAADSAGGPPSKRAKLVPSPPAPFLLEATPLPPKPEPAFVPIRVDLRSTAVGSDFWVGGTVDPGAGSAGLGCVTAELRGCVAVVNGKPAAVTTYVPVLSEAPLLRGGRGETTVATLCAAFLSANVDPGGDDPDVGPVPDDPALAMPREMVARAKEAAEKRAAEHRT
eukprot:gene14741-22558_t